MFCVQCGSRQPEDGKFCSKCGAAIPEEAIAEMLAGAKEAAAGMEMALPAYAGQATQDMKRAAANLHDQPTERAVTNHRRSSGRKWKWILPVVSGALVTMMITGDYFYQHHITKQVEGWLQEGERLSLEGKYTDGLEQIELALAKRPTHPVLLNDRSLLQDALKLKGSIVSAEKQASAKQYDQAIKNIGELQKTLKTRAGAVYDSLLKQSSEKEESFVVQQVTDGIAAKKTVSELVPYLAKLKPYTGEEATGTVKKVKQKIADISYEKATKELESKEFGTALQTVEDAIKLDGQNTKLLALQKTIKTRQEAFEQAEQQRIQRAVEASTKEDLRNRTEGIELLSINAGVDNYGNFVVNGMVKNIATRPISSVTIYYEILDSEGSVLYQNTAYVTPNYLAIGDEGSFSNDYYNDGVMASVSVTRLEWQLE
ncbi:hypothetical protein Back11_36710 [Paenibacillus baekrokdamisoli]|uniref:Uncharacterized protein n=1 Tax=Paenibacillus baekrokdamisoli TaxID=1712516 RepID=A0A3G9IV53_9BACL|nr:FxLYD domain-containing protein [Paenibacillus baekrokdamisoli]MBB3072623.1 hypothetical protein [Paenibacillus baekrokdamisoli]BBH22326.1 hypothetical protein Back11_36710 [Paenibacillus baekrokdamisoli]